MTENSLPGIIEIDPEELAYSSSHAVTETPAQHKRIEDAVNRAQKLQLEVKRAEQDLKVKKLELERTLSFELPEIMDECGVEQLTLKNGLCVKLQKQWWANIPSYTSINEEKDTAKRKQLIARRNAAITWLEENNHADLIQREFNVQFGRGEEEWANEFRNNLKTMTDRELHVTEDENVNVQSLSKLVREMFEDPDQKDSVPRDILGVYEKKTTKITISK